MQGSEDSVARGQPKHAHIANTSKYGESVNTDCGSIHKDSHSMHTYKKRQSEHAHREAMHAHG